MNKEQLAAQLQDLVGRLMMLEAAAREMGETMVAEDLFTARFSVVAATQRVEPPVEVRDAMLVISVNSNATQEEGVAP